MCGDAGNRPDDGCRPDAPARGETGALLIEVLVALVISAGAIFVLVGGMTALSASSAQNRQTTTAGVVARDYAEALEGVVAQASAAAVNGAWCSASYTVPYAPSRGLHRDRRRHVPGEHRDHPAVRAVRDHRHRPERRDRDSSASSCARHERPDSSRAHGEDGFALELALIFLTAVAVIVAALLGFAGLELAVDRRVPQRARFRVRRRRRDAGRPLDHPRNGRPRRVRGLVRGATTRRPPRRFSCSTRRTPLRVDCTPISIATPTPRREVCCRCAPQSVAGAVSRCVGAPAGRRDLLRRRHVRPRARDPDRGATNEEFGTRGSFAGCCPAAPRTGAHDESGLTARRVAPRDRDRDGALRRAGRRVHRRASPAARPSARTSPGRATPASRPHTS